MRYFSLLSTNEKRFISSLVSGFMMALPWMGIFSGFTIFFAFVPLLIITDEYFNDTLKHFSSKTLFYACISFMGWNILATGWIVHATWSGAIVIILTNTLLYALVFTSYGLTCKKLGHIWGGIAFVCYWTCFEGFYTNAEISWPILNLGSSLIHVIPCIQWYEYTGSLGGTIWILTINYLIFNIIRNLNQPFQRSLLRITCTTLILFIPIAISLNIYDHYKEKAAPVKVLILQPNINPYTEKFSGLSQEQQLTILLTLGKSAADQTPDFFLGPETALDNHIWENFPDTSSSIIAIRRFLSNYPNAAFITGATTFLRYGKNEIPGLTAKKDSAGNLYECFNTALLISKAKQIQVYHKSKLVVGVEKIPYPAISHWLGNTFIQLGGISGNLGTQTERSVFSFTGNKNKIAPVICSESDYGEFVTGYIRNGATIIFELTNDGWFGNSSAPDMHLGNACLRAVETRRSIARSSNTGISASINQRGDIVQKIAWWTRGSLNAILNTNESLTFYVKHGDYLYTWTGIISGFMVILVIFQFFRITRKC